jgi:hypothetical protein
MKKAIAVIIILVVVQLTVNVLLRQKYPDKSISLRQKGWATNITFEIADGVARFRQDKKRMPTSLAEMRPKYLPDPDILFPSAAKEIMGLANVTLKDSPEALDISGIVHIYTSPIDDSFFVIISPILFGSENIPIRSWRPGEQNFDVLPLERVRTLISNYNKK